MALDTATILAQIDDVLARCGVTKDNLEPPHQQGSSQYASWFVAGNGTSMSTSCLALIQRLAPNSTYEARAQSIVDSGELERLSTVKALVGVVASLREDVEAGYTSSLVELVHADVFADFLGMASELQRKNFKDAAAVIAGSTLEEHLRKLAAKAQLPTTDGKGAPLKASRLNDDLRAAQVYNPIQQRAVQSWLDLRNACLSCCWPSASDV
jgi:hypothetical protein